MAANTSSIDAMRKIRKDLRAAGPIMRRSKIARNSLRSWHSCKRLRLLYDLRSCENRLDVYSECRARRARRATGPDTSLSRQIFLTRHTPARSSSPNYSMQQSLGCVEDTCTWLREHRVLKQCGRSAERRALEPMLRKARCFENMLRQAVSPVFFLRVSSVSWHVC